MTDTFSALPDGVSIRDFVPDDFSFISEIFNVAYPNEYGRADPAIWAFEESQRDPKYKSRWALAEVDGRPVGWQRSRIPMDMYHPRNFFFMVVVDRGFQRRGIGSALYDHMLQRLEPDDPLLLRCMSTAEMQESIRFIVKRGYKEEERAYESVLHLATFDPTTPELRQAADRVDSAGIEIRRLDELQDEPDWREKLYQIYIHVEADMPMPDPYTPPPREEFFKMVFENPRYLPEATFVAVDGDRYVGVSNLVLGPAGTKELETDTTGVHREYRRRGLATRLKLKAIEYARSVGIEQIRTWNSSENEAMLGINRKLRFAPLPAWIGWVKQVGAGSR